MPTVHAWGCKEFDMTQRLRNSNSGGHAACLSPPALPWATCGHRDSLPGQGTSCALRATASELTFSNLLADQAQGSDTDHSCRSCFLHSGHTLSLLNCWVELGPERNPSRGSRATKNASFSQPPSFPGTRLLESKPSPFGLACSCNLYKCKGHSAQPECR